MSSIWGIAEAEAIAKQIWEALLKNASIFPLPKNVHLSDENIDFLESVLVRLEQKEPLQYILERAYFVDFELFVNSSVLIPRPETEELVLWILEAQNQEEKTVLDICTGSGCIALGLAKKGKFRKISGLDISEAALKVAQKNGIALDLPVDWLASDILNSGSEIQGDCDIWVSNPPYVLHSEAVEMHESVLLYEPEIALFVPDANPLLFYKSIAELASQKLKPGGALYFEINPLFAQETKLLMQNIGFEHVELKKDMFGKLRMLRGFLPNA